MFDRIWTGRMRVAQLDPWPHDGHRDQAGEGATARLETALARIAVAAGRKQEALRNAELTAQSAQHETESLLHAVSTLREEADRQTREAETAMVAPEPVASPEPAPGLGVEALQAMAIELDGLIARLRLAVEPPAATTHTDTQEPPPSGAWSD